MAFWKKSEDPWDQKPKGKPAPFNKLRETPSWVQVKKAPAPMDCPWCGQMMLPGELYTATMGGRSSRIIWQEGHHQSFLEGLGTVGQPKALELGTCENAWYCTDCRKLVMDINATLKSAGPNYVWENGKVKLPDRKDEE